MVRRFLNARTKKREPAQIQSEHCSSYSRCFVYIPMAAPLVIPFSYGHLEPLHDGRIPRPLRFRTVGAPSAQTCLSGYPCTLFYPIVQYFPLEYFQKIV